ncbi:hypothetical protein PYW07_010700 [Mythimna separata]|uniref:Nose resistant-to-fluoxetine protein N-terminal domain-containing protein n=1 Tax=Mythimna separata TaxID=271217 RepID=A0AAD7Y7U0_MYTSE|nr:hypothetical protein PYW07_010700 [Mythimna separata]
MHHPVGTFYGSEYSLGNYEQCLNAPSMVADSRIVTQYCLADVTLTGKKFTDNNRNVLGPTGPYVATKTPIGRNLNKVFWGTCLPSTCKAGAITKILKTMYRTNPVTPSDPDISVSSCEAAGERREKSFGFYAFISLIITLPVLSIIATIYLQHTKNKSGVIHGIADAFSLKRNWSSLTKKSDDGIGSLNLLKVALATLAVSTHTVFFEVMGPISNGLHYDKTMLKTSSPLLNSVKHIDLPVDNFLMVSGLLLVKGLMEKKKKPIVALIQRYFRLTASFSVVIFYVASASMYTGDGPVWQKFAGREQQACADNWWRGLLMLNNYVNSENICLLVSWYIPCDYQLAVMGTMLYLIWQKNKTVGKVVTTVTCILALLVPGLVTYYKKLPGMIVYHDLEKILDFRKNDVYLDTYIRSHNRAGPYLIGMAMGYIISVYKPSNYRNVIAKKKLILPFLLTSIVAYKVVTAPLSWATLEYDHLSSALYAVLSRNLWALCTCVTIGIVEYGDIASIRKFTGWHGFTILSRLAYGIYLTHSVILHQNLYSRKNIQQFDLIYAEGMHSFGVMTMSIVFATLLWMFVEAPLNNIVNLVINPRPEEQKINQRTKQKLERNGVAETSPKIKRS